MTYPTESDLVVILNIPNLPGHVRERLSQAASGGLELHDDLDLELIGIVSGRLTYAGFDADYRPNAEGVALERVLDHLTEEP